jgi:hypothetical protein
MEKELPPFDPITLDSLVDLLDSPAELKQKINVLEQNSHPLPDEVEGFIQYYKLYSGDSEKIKKQLKKLETNFVVPNPQKRNVFLRWAAIFILLIGSSITYYFVQSTNSPQIAVPYEEIGLPNYMGVNKTSNIDWKNVMFLYKTKQYRKLSVIENNHQNDTLSYFQGIASIKDKNIEAGIKKLEEISPKSKYYNKALYFQCIALITINETEKIKSLLPKINQEINDPEFNLKLKQLKNHSSI